MFNHLSVWVVATLAVTAIQAPSASAAPCCASSAAVPALIAGDQARQLGVSVSQGAVIGDAFDVGLPEFRADDSRDFTQTATFDAATLISDRWQVGAQLNVIHRTIDQGATRTESTGLGDVRLSTAYEAWPEFSFSKWTPRGYVFAQITAPTGRSINDSQTLSTVDARGQGFWQAGIGTLLMKRWSSWDIYVLPELHASPGRSFSGIIGQTDVSSFWGGSFALGTGYSPGAGALRFGFRLQPAFRSSRTSTSNDVISDVPNQIVWNTALEAGYLVSDDWMINAGYTDQTLLGPAYNSTLSRSISIGMQRRWSR